MKYDRELEESFNILERNIHQRRAIAIKNLFDKYENCIEDDAIIDFTTSSNARTQTFSKAVPLTFLPPYGINEEDKKHLKIIQDKILKRGKIRISGAEFETSFSGSQLLKTGSRNTTYEANGLDRDVMGKKQPSNVTELHSKCSPRDKGSLLKPVRRINPVQVNVTRLNSDQNVLSKKQPSNVTKLHSKCSPRDKGSLLKPVGRVKPMQVNVTRLSLDQDLLGKEPPDDTELHSKRTPIDKGSILTPVRKINPMQVNVTQLNLDQAVLGKKRPPDHTELHSKRTPIDKCSLLTPVRRLNPMHVRKLNNSLDNIPIALECTPPIKPLTPVGLHLIPKHLPNIPIALECLSPLSHLNGWTHPNTYDILFLKGKKNSSLNVKLDNSLGHRKSVHSMSSYARKSNSRSNRKFEH